MFFYESFAFEHELAVKHGLEKKRIWMTHVNFYWKNKENVSWVLFLLPFYIREG